MVGFSRFAWRRSRSLPRSGLNIYFLYYQLNREINLICKLAVGARRMGATPQISAVKSKSPRTVEEDEEHDTAKRRKSRRAK